MFKAIRSLAFVLAATLPMSASAAVVSVTINSSSPDVITGVVGLPPSGTVGANSNNVRTVFAFNELQNVTLASDLAIDIIAGLIPAGKKIASHYITYDPRGSTSVDATVTFNRKILGLITTRGNLEDSNYLGNPLITYLSVPLTGLEVVTDSVSFSGDFTSLTWTASDPGDHIRVITAAVPLPAGGLLLVGAIGGLALLRRRARA